MELHGVGVGRGMAIGPILRMPDPLPEPPASRHTGDAAAEYATVRHSLAAVAAELTAAGVRAGGTAKDVLQAAAMMAQDPALAPRLLAYFAPFEPQPDHPNQAVLRLYAALQVAALPGQRSLGGYLVGRQLLNVGDGPGARDQLELSLSPGTGDPGLATPELLRGARLMLLEACVRARDYPRAREVLRDLTTGPILGGGHRLELEQWRARVEFFATALPPA